MRVLRFLQNPSDLPWIIISQLILALTVAHFGAVISDDSQKADMGVQDIEMPQDGAALSDGTIYILRMGATVDECIVSTVDGTIVKQTPLAELDIASLDGRLVVDLSLSDETQRFFKSMSQIHQDHNMDMGILTKRGGSR
ncbi:hypothetical protein ACFL6S_24945 [Candidatus Poribacteria bacterium]